MATATQGPRGAARAAARRAASGSGSRAGEEDVGEPEGEAVDEDRLAVGGGGEGAGEVEGGLGGEPAFGAAGAVLGDAGGHLGVQRLGGGDVAPGRGVAVGSSASAWRLLPERAPPRTRVEPCGVRQGCLWGRRARLRPGPQDADERAEERPEDEVGDGHRHDEAVVQALGDRALEARGLRGADEVREDEEGDADGGQGRGFSEEDQREAGGGGDDGAEPPDLAGEELGGGHGGELGRQAEAGGEGEDGEAGEAPEEAAAPAGDAAGEVGGGDEEEREADGGDDVGGDGEGHALEAVGGGPGFGLVGVRGGGGVVVVGGGGGGLVGLGGEDERHGEAGLEHGHRDAGDEAGGDRKKEDVAEDEHVTGLSSVAGKGHRVPVVVAGVVHRRRGGRSRRSRR